MGAPPSEPTDIVAKLRGTLGWSKSRDILCEAAANEITALRSRCEGLERAQQHIGWLKMFIADMEPENWRDLRDRCEDQLEQLSAALRASTREEL